MPATTIRFDFRAVMTSFLLYTVGCSAANPPGPASGPGAPASPPATPTWVLQGSGAFVLEGRSLFVGLGHATGVVNPKVLAKTASHRAHAELAKVLELFIASLLRDYWRAQETDEQYGDGQREECISYAEPMQLPGRLAMAGVAGAQESEHWLAGPDEYAQVVLDLAAYLGEVSKLEGVDPKVKAFAVQHAGRVFGEMRAEGERGGR